MLFLNRAKPFSCHKSDLRTAVFHWTSHLFTLHALLNLTVPGMKTLGKKSQTPQRNRQQQSDVYQCPDFLHEQLLVTCPQPFREQGSSLGVVLRNDLIWRGCDWHEPEIFVDVNRVFLSCLYLFGYQS